MTQKNIFSKSFSWLANHTYRKIPAIIQNLQNKPIQTHYLTYQNLNTFPKNAKNIGFDVIRRAHRKKYHIQSENLQHQKKHRIVQKFITQKCEDYQKPIQLVCPICMDFFSGPVSTTCGHTFCFQCLDQAILFNPNCPVCRNQIRGEELIICKSIQTLILSYFCKFQDQIYQLAFYKKQEEFENWVTQRSIDQQNITEGQEIDVRDTEFVWCKAKVLKIYQKQNKNNSIMVHYDGWSQSYDQIIYLNSQRLANLGFYTNRKQIPHYNLNSDNRSHMYSYVVIQRNNEQNNQNFDPLNDFYMINNEYDNLRSNYLWGMPTFRHNHIDAINEQSISLTDSDDFGQNDTFIMSERTHLNMSENSSHSSFRNRTLIQLESRNELTQFNYQEEENSQSEQNNNSPVNISVEWSESEQQNIRIFQWPRQENLDLFHHHRFVEQNSWNIQQQVECSNFNQEEQNQQVHSLLQLLGIEGEKQSKNVQQNEQDFQDFMTDIWRDWKNYKIINGLLQRNNQNTNEQISLNQKQNELKIKNNKNILNKREISKIQQKKHYLQNKNKKEIQNQFENDDQNSSKNSYEQNEISEQQEQAEKQYELVTFKSLCRQFDSQFKIQLSKEKELFKSKFDPFQQKIQKKRLKDEKKRISLFCQQFNPQIEQKAQTCTQMQRYLHPQQEECEDPQCQLNEQISNFIHRLMETAQESYMKQSAQRKSQTK